MSKIGLIFVLSRMRVSAMRCVASAQCYTIANSINDQAPTVDANDVHAIRLWLSKKKAIWRVYLPTLHVVNS